MFKGRPARSIKAKLQPGDLLIVDNMLWGGRIFDAAGRSAETESVRALTWAGGGRHVAARATIAGQPLDADRAAVDER